VSHLDEQVGDVLAALDELQLRDDTRVIYTSDHGELFGAHGLFGKRAFYEASAGVPLIVAGPDVPAGERRTGHVSHVDLFPSVLEGLGVRATRADSDLPGKSLWQAANRGTAPDRAVFAEYHAHGSSAGAFMIRHENWKLIHHVGMRPQLYDLAADPDEKYDLADRPGHADVQAHLYALLRACCDPEAVDARAKADQVARIEELGGTEVAQAGDVILFSPVPGDELARR
jgi:choline-sulfatase